jgi:8-oxo-dGTP pyrophosphatase MutT (NUDIX family)
MSIQPWKVRESTYLRKRVRLDTCELPNGRLFHPMVLEFHTWANVLALTPDQQAVLIRQYRHGAREVIWEFPGGIVEDGEDPLDGIKRELLEETGYASGKVIEIGRLYPNPANQSNRMHCFVALSAEKVQESTPDEAEDLEVHLVPLDELFRMVERGEFSHALMIATLFQAMAYLKRIS